MNELQTAARPVTGSNARESLLDFFDRASQPSNATSQHRSLPEDAQNLVQRSIVTSLLRRSGFVSALEQSLVSRAVNPANHMQPRTFQQAR